MSQHPTLEQRVDDLVVEWLKQPEVDTDKEEGERLVKMVTAFITRERDAVREECIKKVPTNWTDELLTGRKGIGEPPYDCRDVEKLLRNIIDGMRTLKA